MSRTLDQAEILAPTKAWADMNEFERRRFIWAARSKRLSDLRMAPKIDAGEYAKAVRNYCRAHDAWREIRGWLPRSNRQGRRR